MPIYEYECTQCGDEFETMQSFSDKPLKKCKKCGGKLHKKVSQSSFHLKGSGWYVTDYAGSAKPGTKPSSGNSGDNGSGELKKSQKKTETKSSSRGSEKKSPKPKKSSPSHASA